MIRGTWSLTDPLVPVNVPATMIRVAEHKDISPEEILANTGVELEILGDPAARLSFQQMMIICENLITKYPDGSVGLDLGAAININQFGMLGYAILSCKDLRSALALGKQYHSLVNPAFTFDISHFDNHFEVCFTSHIPFENIYRMACEVFIISFCCLSRFLTGRPDIQPIEVHLNHPEPPYAAKYIEYFECPVLFDQPRTQLVIQPELLDLPLMMADQATAAMAEKQCAEILSRMGPKEGLIAKVRRIMLSDPGNFPSVEELAKDLATSTRTLSRSLQDLGTSYQKLLDEVRKEMAIEYLRNSSLPIEEVAQLVGYNDPSNFRKAFRRWTQNVPSYYRNED